MAIQIRFRGAPVLPQFAGVRKNTKVCKHLLLPYNGYAALRELTIRYRKDQLSKQRTERSQLSQIHKSTSGTYAYPTTNTQPYASSPYGTARSTQQAMYGTTSAFVDTQVNDYKRWAPSQSETYADVKNNLTWTYGEGKSSIHTVDPVTKENLTAHYYSEEYLRTWAFYRQSGEFVHIG
ncbi:unnamed protein product [Alternaria alternata]